MISNSFNFCLFLESVIMVSTLKRTEAIKDQRIRIAAEPSPQRA